MDPEMEDLEAKDFRRGVFSDLLRFIRVELTHLADLMGCVRTGESRMSRILGDFMYFRCIKSKCPLLFCLM